MIDIAMVAIVVAFFCCCLGYVLACDREMPVHVVAPGPVPAVVVEPGPVPAKDAS